MVLFGKRPAGKDPKKIPVRRASAEFQQSDTRTNQLRQIRMLEQRMASIEGMKQAEKQAWVEAIQRVNRDRKQKGLKPIGLGLLNRLQ
ncbi:MAG: hypothetical protein Q7R47_06145 [Candidatus Diapherotrites archaeon]|nr:hypothetical protein [Candidatus Diapherotrites archaeon]